MYRIPREAQSVLATSRDMVNFARQQLSVEFESEEMTIEDLSMASLDHMIDEVNAARAHATRLWNVVSDAADQLEDLYALALKCQPK